MTAFGTTSRQRISRGVDWNCRKGTQKPLLISTLLQILLSIQFSYTSNILPIAATITIFWPSTVLRSKKLRRKGNYDLPGMLDEKQAAAWFGCSTRKLQRHRLDGDGPPYIKLGRLVRYLIPDLLSYAQSNRRHSTSEPDFNG